MHLLASGKLRRWLCSMDWHPWENGWLKASVPDEILQLTKSEYCPFCWMQRATWQWRDGERLAR